MVVEGWYEEDKGRTLAAGRQGVIWSDVLLRIKEE
jgi:hypothetical protein